MYHSTSAWITFTIRSDIPYIFTFAHFDDGANNSGFAYTLDANLFSLYMFSDNECILFYISLS